MTTNLTDELMSVEQVATILGFTNPRSLLNRIQRKQPLPTYIKVPHSRGIQFFRRDVFDFLERCRVEPKLLTDQEVPSSPDESISALWKRPVSVSRRPGRGSAGSGKSSMARRSGTKAPGRSFPATSDARRCV